MAETIVIAGSLAQKPRYGGHSWVFLQYLLGFKRMGWNVLFLDQLEPEMCIDNYGHSSPLAQSLNLRYFLRVMDCFGLNNQFALICNRGEDYIGLCREQVLERVRDSALLLNFMGFLNEQEVLSCAARRVFLDIDPGFSQMWWELELADVFCRHDYFVTISENIGHSDCAIPTCGLRWITTQQPIVLDYWQPQTRPACECFTSIGAWRGPYGPIEYQGRTYGLRVHEFRKFAHLPRLSQCRFQLALDIHSAEVSDIELLTANGWLLVDPNICAGDPWAYQAYIQSSGAEFMVAKNMYVQTNSGWFSDRSICYLASGKPVLAQDTGLKRLYPTGQGLVTFNTLEEAMCGVEEISADYSRHSLAARGIAEEYFDSDKVLSRLLNRLGLG
jgi:hypothetical protein